MRPQHPSTSNRSDGSLFALPPIVALLHLQPPYALRGYPMTPWICRTRLTNKWRSLVQEVNITFLLQFWSCLLVWLRTEYAPRVGIQLQREDHRAESYRRWDGLPMSYLCWMSLSILGRAELVQRARSHSSAALWRSYVFAVIGVAGLNEVHQNIRDAASSNFHSASCWRVWNQTG